MPSWSLEFNAWGIVDKSSIVNIKHMSGSWALSINLKKGFLIVAGDLHEKVNQTELWIRVAKSQIECSHRRYTNELVGWHTTYDYSLHFHTIYTTFLHDLQHFFIKCVRWCSWILPLHTSDEVLGICVTKFAFSAAMYSAIHDILLMSSVPLVHLWLPFDLHQM